MSALSGGAASMAIARLTMLRFLRSKSVLVAALFAFIPLVPFAFGAAVDSSPAVRWEHYIKLAAFVQMLVAALLMAPAIAEEIDYKTYTYLWSRPIPRWSVLVGKLLAGSLVGALLMALSALAAVLITGLQEQTLLLKGVAALSLGIIAVGSISATLGVFLPKHPLSAAITYFLLLDALVGALPFAGARLSVMHNVLALSGHGPDAASLGLGLLWLLGVATFWLALAFGALNRKELSTGS